MVNKHVVCGDPPADLKTNKKTYSSDISETKHFRRNELFLSDLCSFKKAEHFPADCQKYKPQAFAPNPKSLERIVHFLTLFDPALCRKTNRLTRWGRGRTCNRTENMLKHTSTFLQPSLTPNICHRWKTSNKSKPEQEDESFKN